MSYLKLKQNMIDMIREQQIKLGYRSEAVRLYYPRQSQNRFLDNTAGVDELQELLSGICEELSKTIGEVTVSHQGERFCFLFSPKVSDYVHEHMEGAEFIQDFVAEVSRHGAKLEDVLAVFYRYSDHVHVERVAQGDFDYVVYFEDGIPDSYRYCITDEGCHIIYHRFTEEDYRDFTIPSQF